MENNTNLSKLTIYQIDNLPSVYKPMSVEEQMARKGGIFTPRDEDKHVIEISMLHTTATFFNFLARLRDIVQGNSGYGYQFGPDGVSGAAVRVIEAPDGYGYGTTPALDKLRVLVESGVSFEVDSITNNGVFNLRFGH